MENEERNNEMEKRKYTHWNKWQKNDVKRIPTSDRKVYNCSVQKCLALCLFSNALTFFCLRSPKHLTEKFRLFLQTCSIMHRHVLNVKWLWLCFTSLKYKSRRHRENNFTVFFSSFVVVGKQKYWRFALNLKSALFWLDPSFLVCALHQGQLRNRV